MTNSTYVELDLVPTTPDVLQYRDGLNRLIKIYTFPPETTEPWDPTPPPKLEYVRNPSTLTAAPKLLIPTTVTTNSVFDNPLIGGKFTAFVLLYGPSQFFGLHRRCLDSIIATVPVGRIDLRVISNELCTESVAYVEQLQAQGIVSKHYRNLDNRRKYPAMREAFYDTSHPIKTKFIIWFDDDTVCDKDPSWLNRLADAIIANPQAAMFGAQFYSQLNNIQMVHYRKQPWWKGKPLMTQHGKAVPNGDKATFAAGGFWALSTQAMLACDIPAKDLKHNGGDICIGVQLAQGGYALCPFNGQKQFVNTSAAPRRGITEPHYGTIGFQQL